MREKFNLDVLNAALLLALVWGASLALDFDDSVLNGGGDETMLAKTTSRSQHLEAPAPKPASL